MDKEKEINESQFDTSKDATKKSGCGCGCKSAPVDDEVVGIEEEEWNY